METLESLSIVSQKEIWVSKVLPVTDKCPHYQDHWTDLPENNGCIYPT
jgi:hypothetical protein